MLSHVLKDVSHLALGYLLTVFSKSILLVPPSNAQLPVPKFKIVLETSLARAECWGCFGGRALIRNGCHITSVCR